MEKIIKITKATSWGGLMRLQKLASRLGVGIAGSDMAKELNHADVRRKDDFFEKLDELGLAVTFGDVLVKTGRSKVPPAGVDLRTRFSRNVFLLNPLASSAMDDVTEAPMAIELAKCGGIGVIHRNMSPEKQAGEVVRVKFYVNGLIPKPKHTLESETVEHLLARRKEKGWPFHSFPVLNDAGKLVGIVTKDDIERWTNESGEPNIEGLTVGQIMSTEPITAEEGITPEEAMKIIMEKRKNVLPILDKSGNLKSMYVLDDLKRIIGGGSTVFNLDKNGQLKVGAAVGVGEEALERAELLVRRNVDVIVIDASHGHNDQVRDTLKEIKLRYPGVDVVAGNVAESESAKFLADAGADGIKVGIGPGSICTTRIINGTGCPQITAIHECERAIRGSGIPICADGGIKYSGDIVAALAAGAHSVMIGSLFAGTKESPAKIIYKDNIQYKEYRGMGSEGAMKESAASRERYKQTDARPGKTAPEGVEARVLYKGEVAGVINLLLSGLRNGMSSMGAVNMDEMHAKADFRRQTANGVRESHPHDVEIIKEAPNYS